jgi:hypothetical protein
MNCTVFEIKGRDPVEVLSQYLPEETERNVKNLSVGQDRWLTGQDLSGGPPEYVSKLLIHQCALQMGKSSISQSLIYFISLTI